MNSLPIKAWDSFSLTSLTGSSIVNVDPFPTRLLTLMCPLCESTMDLAIESPRPLPSYFRDNELSTCIKGSNMLSILSSGIPIPVSLIDM